MLIKIVLSKFSGILAKTFKSNIVLYFLPLFLLAFFNLCTEFKDDVIVLYVMSRIVIVIAPYFFPLIIID